MQYFEIKDYDNLRVFRINIIPLIFEFKGLTEENVLKEPNNF